MNDLYSFVWRSLQDEVFKCILSSINTSRREQVDSRQTVITGVRNLFANARRKSIANMPT